MANVGSGTVVNVASTYAIAADQGWSAYTAAKAGVIGITKACTVDYGHLNIRFNCVCPGGIITEGVSTTNPYAPQQNYWNFYSEALLARLTKSENTLKRIWLLSPSTAGRLDLWAEARRPLTNLGHELFLSCDDSSWVTGAIIPVDGGETSLIAGTVVRNLTETGAI